MAKGRGRAVVAIVVLCQLVMVLQCELASAARYVVGGSSSGWKYGVMGWENGKQFKADDVLADDEQYHSQPTKNSLSWFPNKWRRLSLKNHATSPSVPKTTMNDGTKDVMDEAAKVPVEDAQDKNESRTMSRDAMEFYNNGMPILLFSDLRTKQASY
ncbi:hypothetical protein R6Q57_009397 [Mikania cordata]